MQPPRAGLPSRFEEEMAALANRTQIVVSDEDSTALANALRLGDPQLILQRAQEAIQGAEWR
jgi:hypothetical protein